MSLKKVKGEYLKTIAPTLRRLLSELEREYSYVSILATDSCSKRYQLARSGVTVSTDAMLSTRGCCIRVFDGKGYCEYSTNKLCGDIDSIVDEIKSNLIPLGGMLPGCVDLSTYPTPEDESATLDFSSEYELHADEISDGEIIERLSAIREKGLKHDERILDVNISCMYREYHKLFLSKNKELEQNVLWMTGTLLALARRGDELKDCFRGYSCLGGIEFLSRLDKDVESIAETVVELLSSEPMIPGEYDCVCTPEVTGMIVHEAFGHGVEMDMFVKNRALAKDFIGKQVASELVTMRDSASAMPETATFAFDDEGTLAGNTLIIDKGILKGGMCDSLSAATLKTKPTGNGRRESYERKAYTRMTNTYFEGGNDTVESMIASIKYGFLLESPTSGMEDPKNWGIQCMVNFAREIKDGKLTGKIFSPIVLTGYVPDLLKSVSMISKDIELNGCGFCGKGYKEWVKVSDGGPYIKARIRLG